MQTPRDYWSAWAERLQTWKLDAIAAWLLEAGGPLTVLGAQALYFTRPFFNSPQVQILAKMLEEDDEARSFADYLRQDASV